MKRQKPAARSRAAMRRRVSAGEAQRHRRSVWSSEDSGKMKGKGLRLGETPFVPTTKKYLMPLSRLSWKKAKNWKSPCYLTILARRAEDPNFTCLPLKPLYTAIIVHQRSC